MAVNPLDSVVGVNAAIRTDARTREILGREREGSGIVIDDTGLILTIGFLILEAESVDVVTSTGQLLPAEVVAYHGETGFGLLRASSTLDAPAARLGTAGRAERGDRLLVAAFGGQQAVQPVVVTDRRTFTGAWEYLLDEAIFTAPAHSAVAGAGLFDRDGSLLGIGYLTMAQTLGRSGMVPGNMFVPVDALRPVMADLLAEGRSPGVPRPWLGLYLEEERGRLFVDRIARGGPADRAGLREGDIVLNLDNLAVRDRERFYRMLWRDRRAGDSISLRVLQGTEIRQINVQASDRYKWYKVDGQSY